MPIGISDAAVYRFVGPVLVILCSVIIVLYSDVPTGTYCSVTCYSFSLEDVGLRFRLYINNNE